MSVKKQINDIETAISKLKSNELDFESQIKIYEQTLKKAGKLNKTINELSQRVKDAELSKNES